MAKSNKLTLILAKKGSGKTILGTALAFASQKPLFIISPNLHSIATFAHDCVYTAQNLGDLEFDFENIKKTKSHTIFYLQKDEFEPVLSALMSFDNICIFIDELDFYLGSATNNESSFFKLINYGRHKEIDLIAIARRAQDIPKTLTSQMDLLFVGKQGLDINDKKYISAFVGEQKAERTESFKVGDFYKIDLINSKIDFVRIPTHIVDSISKKEYLTNEYN